MKHILWLLIAGTLTVQAGDTSFWRISSGSTAVVTIIDINGTLAWSNSVPWNNEQVQRATMLEPVADWQDYVLVPATGSTVSVRAFDLNPPSGMVLIPAGTFVMGNATNVFPADDGDPDELPQHTVSVSEFYMDAYEVTKTLWDDVTNFNGGNGYVYCFPGSGKAANHPVQMVSWYDCIAWCNARSQRDGLTPCYTNANGTVYKFSSGSYFNGGCNWSANGYRLPTEAEWEKAARGGVANTRFPWLDFTNKISWAKANYYGVSSWYSYDLSGGDGTNNPTFNDGIIPYTSPVGYFAPNEYGLYDMAGNIFEWCWDWYDGAYYSSSPGTDPRGPVSGTNRVWRGGAYNYNSFVARVANRYSLFPGSGSTVGGFRCVRGP